VGLRLAGVLRWRPEGKRRCEELTTGLTGAQGATERRGDEGEVAAVVGLDGSVLRCEGGGERGGEGCRITPGGGGLL
jgi:hypothetical protein